MAQPTRNIDLHLLECFDLLMRERSVSRAAEYLGVSQSSASEMLARLRERFADPLFVRTRDGLQPTPRAQELLPSIRSVAEQLRSLLEEGPSFVAASSQTRFRLVTSDYSQFLLMPGLARLMMRDAPACSVDVLPMNILLVEQALGAGDIDLAIAYFPDPPAALRRSPLFTDTYACVARTGHPALCGPLEPAGFAALSHVRVAPSGLNYFSNSLEAALAAHGLQRKITVSSPHFLLAAHLVSQSDLVLTLPRQAAETLARYFPLALFDLPVTMNPVDISMYWHERTHHSPSHQWLREQVRAVLAHEPAPAPLRVT